MFVKRRTDSSVACSAVFTWTNLLVVVVELDGSESEALDLVPLVTSAVLEEHHLIVGVAVVVDPGVVPINSRGEKQRMHLRDGFLADQLDPIYVAYNMWTCDTPNNSRLLFIFTFQYSPSWDTKGFVICVQLDVVHQVVVQLILFISVIIL